MKKLLQINPVLRRCTSTGRIMQEIGELAIECGWESYIAYSAGRDGRNNICRSKLIPIGNRWSVWIHGLMTRLFDRHGLQSNRATRQFIAQIEQLRPDIIHLHNIHGYFLNYRMLFDYLATIDTPVIWTIHDCWLYTGHCYYYDLAKCYRWQTHCERCPQKNKFPRSWFVDRSRKNFEEKRQAFTSLPKSQILFVPVSEWMKNELQHSFLKAYNFRVIHNGIDTEIFTPSDIESTKEKYGIRGKHMILGVASIWSHEKGLDDFMALAKTLSEDEQIILVGVTPQQIKILPPIIKGITRTENSHELALLYAAADVFVNPTWQDNYPTVNLESIACGTPVVTYRTGGSVEAITEATGRVVEQGDIPSLRSAITEIERLGKQAFYEPCRQYACAHFNKKDRYADYIRLYDELSAK